MVSFCSIAAEIRLFVGVRAGIGVLISAAITDSEHVLVVQCLFFIICEWDQMFDCGMVVIFDAFHTVGT